MIRFTFVSTLALGLLLAGVTQSQATTGTWKSTGSGVWGNGSYWTGGRPIAAADIALFNGVNVADDTTLVVNLTGTSQTSVTAQECWFGDTTSGGTTTSWQIRSTNSGYKFNFGNSPSRIDVDASLTGYAYFSCQISGSAAAIRKTGLGKLCIQKDSHVSNHDYSGWFTNEAGIVRIETSSGLGSTAGGTVVLTGAALEINGSISVGAEPLTLNGAGISTGGALRNISGTSTFAGPITLGSATRINSDSGTLTLNVSSGDAITGPYNLSFGGAGNITVSAPITTGASLLAMDGAGTLTLSGINTYSGTTTASAGVLNIQNASALGTTDSGTLVNGGAALQIQGGIAVGAEALTLNGTGIASDGALRNISGSNSWGGTITLGSAARINSDSGTLAIDVGAGNAITGTYNLTFGGAANIIVINPIATGTGTVTKDGAGTLTLSGTNTYSGATTVSAGVLNIQNAAATGTTAGGVSVTSGAALQLQGGITVGAEALTLNGTGISNDGALRNISDDNTWGGLITLGSAVRINSDSGTLTLDVASGNAITGTTNLTFGGAGNITVADPIAIGAGTLTKDGAGALTLSGANTYTGTTTVSAGTLALGGNNVLPSSTTVNLNGGTLDMGTKNNTVTGLQFDGTPKTAGTWGSPGSGALNTSPRFTGTGILTVTAGGTTNTMPTTTLLARTTGGNPSTYNDSLTFTASVQTNGVTAGNANGNMVIRDGATPLSTNNVVGGVVFYTNSTLSAGLHSLTAEYSGNDNYLPSSSSPALSQQVQVAATTITLASSLNPAALGAGVVFTATVKTTNAVTIPTATGSVIFRDGLTALFTSSAITAGVVKYTNSALAYGPHSITAEYSGNSNCLAGTNSPALNQIISIPTTITLVSSSNPSIYLGNAQFTATVLAGGVTATNAGGTMILKRSGTSLVTNTVTSGVATYNLTSLAPGTNLMTATYVGDPVYLTSSSGTLTQTVQIAVTVVLQSLINPGVEGTPGSYQIDLQTNGVNVGGTLSGSITLKDGANVLGIPVPVTSSTSYGSDYGSLAAGWHYLTAEYSGDGDLFVASTNLVPVAQAISSSSQTPTTLTLGSSPNPSTTGNRVTFTATVSAADATGTVVFKDAGVMLGSGGVTNGAATYGTSALAGGVHAITAEYSGNTTYGPSPAGLSQTNRIQTTMVLASSANPSINGSSFTLTATVQTNGATAGAATGTVVFKDGGTALNTNAVGGGVATYSTSALALGSHSLTAEYSGSSDSLYLASTNSPALTQVVKWATTTAVASSLNPSTNGNTVIFTATIKTNNATATAATGTMTFKSGGSALGSPGVTNGVATFQTSGLPTGTSSITAEYSGDSAYLASVSSALPQVVQSAGPTTLPTVSYSVNGTTLTLSWPADYLGWTLQGQTNAAGIGAGWGDIPGTALVTSTNLPVMPANPAVFYRLRHSNP